MSTPYRNWPAVRLRPDLHHRLKLEAVQTGDDMKDIADKAVEDELKRREAKRQKGERAAVPA